MMMIILMMMIIVIIVVHDVIVDNGALVGQVLVQVMELAVPFRYDPTSPRCCCCCCCTVIISIVVVVNFTYSDVIHCIE